MQLIKYRIFVFTIVAALVFSTAGFSQSADPAPTGKHKKSKDNYGQVIVPKPSGNSFTYHKTESTYKEKSKKESENYFRVDKSKHSLWNGKHWEVTDYPLKVYVKKSSSIYFKDDFTDYVTYAFKLWQKADARIVYEFTNNSRNADIIIRFEENLMDKYDEEYLGLTDYKLEKNKKIKESTIEISLLKFDDVQISDGEIKFTIIHEIGHALGLGHSDNMTDIMYPFISQDVEDNLNFDELSEGDIQAIKSVIDLGFYNRFSKN